MGDDGMSAPFWEHAATRIAALEQQLARAVEALEEAAEYVDRFADMRDGDYGAPEPNEAMQLAHSLRQALASIKGGRG